MILYLKSACIIQKITANIVQNQEAIIIKTMVKIAKTNSFQDRNVSLLNKNKIIIKKTRKKHCFPNHSPKATIFYWIGNALCSHRLFIIIINPFCYLPSIAAFPWNNQLTILLYFPLKHFYNNSLKQTFWTKKKDLKILKVSKGQGNSNHQNSSLQGLKISIG